MKQTSATPISTLGLFRLLLVMALVVISYLAFTPQDTPVVVDLNDKVSHILAFVVLAFLADFSWPKSPWALVKAVPLLGYGLFIEAVQSFLPHRLFSMWDLGADAIGLLIYPLLLPLLLRSSLLKGQRNGLTT
jgi:VanZ family protein